MDRKTFLKTCGYACLGGVALASLLQSCQSIAHIDALQEGRKLVLSKNAFIKSGKATEVVIVHSQALDYPVVVYKTDHDQYQALLLRCTHQGAELQVFGKQIICPAHGSEFDQQGQVLQGPASGNLQQFPLETDENNIYIKIGG